MPTSFIVFRDLSYSVYSCGKVLWWCQESLPFVIVHLSKGVGISCDKSTIFSAWSYFYDYKNCVKCRQRWRNLLLINIRRSIFLKNF